MSCVFTCVCVEGRLAVTPLETRLLIRDQWCSKQAHSSASRELRDYNRVQNLFYAALHKSLAAGIVGSPPPPPLSPLPLPA